MTRTRAAHAALSAFALIACLAAVSATADDWTIPERVVPPPAAASDSLREHLDGLPAPDPSARPPGPATRTEWVAAVRSVDGMWAEAVEARLPELPLTVTATIADGVPAHRIVPDQPEPRFDGKLFIDLHGGAYVFGNGKAGLTEALVVAERAGIDVLAVDYRMPPLAEPFPAAVDDAVVAYLAMLRDYAPGDIAVGGTSAGGGLALALVQRLKQIEAPLPGALYAGTPWADLTKTGDSQFTNERLDNVLVSYASTLESAARLYVGPNGWRDPLLSPVYGEFDGFPPTMLITGTRDLFLSDTVRVHRKLRAAGVDADLHVYEGLAHAEYYILANSPESADAYRELKAFLLAALD